MEINAKNESIAKDLESKKYDQRMFDGENLNEILGWNSQEINVNGSILTPGPSSLASLATTHPSSEILQPENVSVDY